jgi:RNA polymerase sigma-70 factor, ECF subfamily
MELLNSQLAECAPERSERELLRRIAARDREAMRELHPLYYRRLARFLRRMTRRHDLVDEIINDTLFVVWEKAGDFRGDSRVSTWIMGIAYRRGLSLLRAQYRADEPMVLPTTEEEHLRHSVAEQSDLAELLERALESLSPDHRAVLELTYHLGHSCGEIAAIMDCPVNTVKTRLFHARNRLRALIPALAAPRGEPIAGDPELSSTPIATGLLGAGGPGTERRTAKDRTPGATGLTRV